MLRIFKLFVVFLALLVKVSSLAGPKEAGIRLLFEERLAITYALLAQGESEQKKLEIFNRARKYFSAYFNTEFQTVKVENFNQFLKQFTGEWPDTHKVSLDLEKIEAAGPRQKMIFVSDSPRVQRQIDNYLKSYRDWHLGQLHKVREPILSFVGKITDNIGNYAMFLFHPDLVGTTGNLAMETMEELIEDRMTEFDLVGEKIANSGFSQQQDPAVRILMETLFSQYFSRLSSSTKKLMVSSYLGGPIDAGDFEKFEMMIQNSGPAIQKFLQVVARKKGIDPSLKNIFKRLEDAVRPVPWNQVEEILERERLNWDFVYFERKPLGVGTMAQVHRAKIRLDGKIVDVVVRFIKPDILDRIEEDRRILLEIAKILDADHEFRKSGYPKLTPIMDDVIHTLIYEYNQIQTIENQIFGKSRYEVTELLKTPEFKSFLEIHVPKVYKCKNKGSQLMVQEMVIGSKIEKETDQYFTVAPGLKRKVVEMLVRIWLNEVIFGKGFYHSDLHPGNFTLRVTELAVKLNILDFGMGGRIDSNMQRKMMLLGAGIELLNPEVIVRAFWDLSMKKENLVDRKTFEAMVQKKAQSMSSPLDAKNTVELWAGWAMDQGIKFPYEFISLNRGVGAVVELLDQVDSNLTLKDIFRSLAKQHPVMAYEYLVVKEKLSHQDFIKLGWDELKMMINPPKLANKSKALMCGGIFLVN